MRFAAGSNVVSFSVIIHNEGLVEDDEVFNIHLDIPSAFADLGVVFYDDIPGRVTIRDVDSECSSNPL